MKKILKILEYTIALALVTLTLLYMFYPKDGFRIASSIFFNFYKKNHQLTYYNYDIKLPNDWVFYYDKSPNSSADITIGKKPRYIIDLDALNLFTLKHIEPKYLKKEFTTKKVNKYGYKCFWQDLREKFGYSLLTCQYKDTPLIFFFDVATQDDINITKNIRYLMQNTIIQPSKAKNVRD